MARRLAFRRRLAAPGQVAAAGRDPVLDGHRAGPRPAPRRRGGAAAGHRPAVPGAGRAARRRGASDGARRVAVLLDLRAADRRQPPRTARPGHPQRRRDRRAGARHPGRRRGAAAPGRGRVRHREARPGDPHRRRGRARRPGEGAAGRVGRPPRRAGRAPVLGRVDPRRPVRPGVAAGTRRPVRPRDRAPGRGERAVAPVPERIPAAGGHRLRRVDLPRRLPVRYPLAVGVMRNMLMQRSVPAGRIHAVTLDQFTAATTPSSR